ncbi:Gfo/Idh/MocA family protein [Cohnella caldifontis]|uniref:Gfo/Idh/MocA family protein n=1 Tax=Cohnella caldifontis TaxID=3027471 RepID=UPI0023EDC5BB|nr:Gfo/Idh/MocA family oxidoreductase [Cohnella sp. YIM B05605]
MSIINVCIVGCGRISTLNALGYVGHPDARIYAVCDINESQARSRAVEWQAEVVYTDYRDVLKDPNIHAVELLVPHHLHASMTVQACKAGKHVSVQKPMALSLEEADLMISAAKEAGVKLKVYENFVCYPPYVKAKQLIDAGEIGEPISIRIKSNAGKKGMGWHIDASTWAWRMKEEESGGGPLVFDDGYHKFSVAMYLLGDVEKVNAWIDRTETVPGISWQDAPAMIMWKYRDAKKYGMMDIMSSPDLTIATNYYGIDERVEVTGTRGVLWVTRCTAKMMQIPALMVYKDGKMETYNHLRDDWADSFVDSTKDFIEAIKQDREPMLSGERGREVLRFALAAIESSKRNKEVHLDELESGKTM